MERDVRHEVEKGMGEFDRKGGTSLCVLVGVLGGYCFLRQPFRLRGFAHRKGVVGGFE